MVFAVAVSVASVASVVRSRLPRITSAKQGRMSRAAPVAARGARRWRERCDTGRGLRPAPVRRTVTTGVDRDAGTVTQPGGTRAMPQIAFISHDPERARVRRYREAVRRTVSWVVVLATIVAYPVNAQQRDSAGIRIIENQTPRWARGAERRLSRSPTLVIGTQDGEPYQFSRIGGVIRLSDGTIVVADGASSELRFFDSTGRHVRTVGRPGQGPGEFTRLELIARLRGDTIVAGGYTGVPSFFSPSGVFLRQARQPGSGGDVPPGPRVQLGVFDDGSRLVGVVSMEAQTTNAPGRWVDSLSAFIIEPDGTVRRPFGNVPHLTFVRGETRPHPPWLAPILAMATDGRSLFLGFGNEYAIRVYSADGKLTRVIRRRWSPVKITDADIDTFVTEWSKRWIKETGAEGERRKRDLRDDPYSDIVPAFSQFIADGTGGVWVREAHIADAPGAGQLNTMPIVPSTWSVFDAQGRWSGDVTMPARFMPMDIGAEHVLGVARDSDGVETVVMYRLEGRP